MKITKRQLLQALKEAKSIKNKKKSRSTMKITKRQLRRIIKEAVAAEMEEEMPAAPPAPKMKKKRWKTEITDDYDKGYKEAMADQPPPEEASRSYDDGYTDALADIAEQEELAMVQDQPMV